MATAHSVSAAIRDRPARRRPWCRAPSRRRPARRTRERRGRRRPDQPDRDRPVEVDRLDSYASGRATGSAACAARASTTVSSWRGRAPQATRATRTASTWLRVRSRWRSLRGTPRRAAPLRRAATPARSSRAARALERRSKPGRKQVPRGCDRAADDEAGRFERLEPRSEHLAQRRRDLVERRSSTLVAAASATGDLRDVDVGSAVALDQRGPRDRLLDRSAAVREAVDLTGRRDPGPAVDDPPVRQEGAPQPRPQCGARRLAPSPFCRPGPPFAEPERIGIVEELHRHAWASRSSRASGERRSTPYSASSLCPSQATPLS